MAYDDMIEKHARRVGIDPKWMHQIMRIESSGRPNEQTGSYKGLFQLSDREFKAHGGSGSIFDPEQNISAAANKLAQESRDFKDRHGRDPKLIDMYMVHQQGAAGYSAHLANPEGTAWQNVRQYYKSEAVAKEAIWRNLPASEKARLGSVENVKSKDIVGAWDDAIKGGGPQYGGTAMASAEGKTEGKIAFLEGKDPKKGSILGGTWPEDEPIRAPSGMTVPDLTPRFKIA